MAAAICGFGVLYLAARQFDGEYAFFGLSDNAIRAMAHFTVYGTLALLTAKALFNQYLLAWIISVLLSTGEEIRQLFIPYRFGSVGDWMINVAGITLFLAAARLAGAIDFSRLTGRAGQVRVANR